ncbi:MAG: putative topoisomerase protein [Rhizobium sp.]|nr:putative topoisomerase protein [Rhizobium sp.]
MDIRSLRSAGLIYVSDAEPGIRRENRGTSFCYRLPDGNLLRDESEISRIRTLGIPPAYRNVWICLDPQGHLQATGLDARERKQYRYHPDWQALRSDRKFDQLVQFGEALPGIRRRISRDLNAGIKNERGVLAALAVLLDLAHLRVGNMAYARDNKTFGATTLLKRHLRIHPDRIELKFVAKGGKKVQRTLKHPRLQHILEQIADLPGRRLFAWKDLDGGQHSIDSGKLNAYLSDAADFAISAKTFRTWGGSLAAFERAVQILDNGETPTMKSLCEAASVELHNTPTICRKSYIHPTVLSLAEVKSDPLKWYGKWKKRSKPRDKGLRAEEAALLGLLKTGLLRTIK